jgi:hypothetical protein
MITHNCCKEFTQSILCSMLAIACQHLAEAKSFEKKEVLVLQLPHSSHSQAFLNITSDKNAPLH